MREQLILGFKRIHLSGSLEGGGVNGEFTCVCATERRKKTDCAGSAGEQVLAAS